MPENISADGLWATGYKTITIRAADLTAAALTQTISFGLPDGARVYRAKQNVGAFFTGGGVTVVNTQVGNGADPNGLNTVLNVFAVTALGDWTVASNGVEDVDGATGALFVATNDTEILFTSVTANLDQIVLGVLHVNVWWDRMIDPPV